MKARMKPRSIIAAKPLAPSFHIQKPRVNSDQRTLSSSTKAPPSNQAQSKNGPHEIRKAPGSPFSAPSSASSARERLPHISLSTKVPQTLNEADNIEPDSSKKQIGLDYDDVVASILSHAPATLRDKFDVSKDPRILFPLVRNQPAQKKVLEQWLEDHYFIPAEMESPIPASKPSSTVMNPGKPIPSRSKTSASVFTKPPTKNKILSHASIMENVTDRLENLEIDSKSVKSSRNNRLRKASLPETTDQKIHSSGLQKLLGICGQVRPYDFDFFVSNFRYGVPWNRGDDAKPTKPRTNDSDMEVDMSSHRWRKIGEASFSEVFQVDDVVLKIIPLLAGEENRRQQASGSSPQPAVTNPDDVLKEVNATRIMGEVHSGFTKLLGYVRHYIRFYLCGVKTNFRA